MSPRGGSALTISQGGPKDYRLRKSRKPKFLVLSSFILHLSFFNNLFYFYFLCALIGVSQACMELQIVIRHHVGAGN